MDIGSNNKYPANKLSNFTRFKFDIDGVECGSMEGFLQSLKFENLDSQKITASFSGIQAKRKGQKRNKHWKNGQQLWWLGKVYGRKSREYQELLDRAFECLYDQNEKFRSALNAAGDAKFTHSIGKNKGSETVLTSSEFCSRLQRLKDKP